LLAILERLRRRGAPATEFDARVDPPRFLFLEVNQRCNLKCTHCSIWHKNNDDRSTYLDQKGKRRVMDEFHAMNPNGAVVICGGENMLDIDEYFNISRHCRKLGLTCLSVVNGTRIRGAAMAERMMLEGPHEISVSLNSHKPSLHDETRGVVGSFDKAVAAIRHLVAARRRVGDGKTRIYVMGLIFDQNYRDLEDFYNFVLNELGADKLKLNFLQPSFGETQVVDHFFAEHHKVDPDELITIIRRCNERFALRLSPAWMANVHMYFKSLQGARDLEKGWSTPARTSAHICNTYERNIMVNRFGVARLCFSTNFRGVPLEAEGDLRKFWLEAEDIRRRMRKCNQFCGISHSVRRLSSTLIPAAFSLPAPRSSGAAARAASN
jgi:MoaA/NifB/PqqE/SkfB family radical SAM enzyme